MSFSHTLNIIVIAARVYCQVLLQQYTQHHLPYLAGKILYIYFNIYVKILYLHLCLAFFSACIS